MEAIEPNFLQVDKARLGYRGRALPLADLSFHIPQNRIATLIGPNGSGKSTLLRAMIGEKFLISGEILLGNEAISSRAVSPERLAELVAFIPQELVFPAHLSIRNTLRSAFISRLGWFGKPSDNDEAEVQDALTNFGLSEISEKSLSAISAGERQRVFLARGFLQPAAILVWDEPTNHLDPLGTELFGQALIRAQATKKRSILLATHDERLVGRVSDWVVAIRKEGLVYSGPLEKSGPASLFQNVFGLTPSQK